MINIPHDLQSKIRLFSSKEENNFAIRDNEKPWTPISESIVENIDSVHDLLLSDCRIGLICITKKENNKEKVL